MDRLPDIQRAPIASARPEAAERPQRDASRAPRARFADAPAEDAQPAQRVDDRQGAAKTEKGSPERAARFEVQAQPARETAAQPQLEAATQPAAAAVEHVAELIAQQPALRGRAPLVAPADPAAIPAKESQPVAVPLALPVHLDAVVLTAEAPIVEARPSEAHAAPRAIASAAAQPVTETQSPVERVEAPAEPRETRPARELERAADILRQVRVHLAPRTGEAHIQLEPRDLGRVSIHVAVEDGHMRASVRAETREALDAIQAHLPELRATLRDSGIATQEFQFSLGLENQPRRDAQHQPGGRDPHAQSQAAETRDAEHAVLLRATAAASGVDLYA